MTKPVGQRLAVFSDDDVEFVRGHVTWQEAREGLQPWWREEMGEDAPDPVAWAHQWVRWVPGPRGSDHPIYLHNAQPGARGAFPVTALYYDDGIARAEGATMLVTEADR